MLFGGGGGDVLTGGRGADIQHGDDGSDLFVFDIKTDSGVAIKPICPSGFQCLMLSPL